MPVATSRQHPRGVRTDPETSAERRIGQAVKAHLLKTVLQCSPWCSAATWPRRAGARATQVAEGVFEESATPWCDPISEPLSAAASCPGTVHVSPFRAPAVSWRGHVHAPGAPMFGTSSAVQAGPTRSGRDGRIGEISLRHANPSPSGCNCLCRGQTAHKRTKAIVSDHKRS